MRTAPPLLLPLFRSDGQARLLAAVYLDDDELSIHALADRIGLSYAATHREVERLVEAGVLADRRVGNVRLVRADDTSVLAAPLRQLLTVSLGPVPMLVEALKGIDGIEFAAVFGSFAARTLGQAGPAPGDVDVLVIGQPDPLAVFDVCSLVGREVNRPVNPTILTREEWGDGSSFAAEVGAGPLVPLVGDVTALVSTP